MATYKKRGYKPKTKTEKEQAEQIDSTTAEVFNTLDETASKSEQWIEKNSKPLFYGLLIIAVLILGYLVYSKFVAEPTEKEAANELAFPRKYFDDAILATGSAKDSLFNLGLEGADGNYGFVDIASSYSGTKAGNLANYYAGISYLKMNKYEEAISHLEDFDSNDELLGPTALGAVADTFADINQLEDALIYYKKAANKKDNEFTSPLFLFKAGQIAILLGEFSEAENFFTTIKEKYPKSQQGTDIDKYINAAKYAK